jgi:nucleolar protein 56
MIIQAIALLDQLDKDVNLFSMRVREWYGYHFPELAKLVPDNYLYAKTVQFIGPKESLNEDKVPDLTTLLEDDATKAQNVLDASRGSMGASLSETRHAQHLRVRHASRLPCRLPRNPSPRTLPKR